MISVCAVAALVLGYLELSQRQHRINPRDATIPSFGQLADGFTASIKPDSRTGKRPLLVDTEATLTRLFYGMGISVLLAILLGVHMGCFSVVEYILLPPMRLFSKMIPTAMLAVFFAVVGTGEGLNITMIVFGVLPTMAMAVYYSMRDVPEELVNKAYTLGATSVQTVWFLMVPQIIPKIIDTIRLSIGPAMVYLIAAEYALAEVGFGYRIRVQSHKLDMSSVYIYILLLACFGFAAEYLLGWAQRRLSPWYEKAA